MTKFCLISNYLNSRGVFRTHRKSKMELFAKIVKGFQLLTIFIKSSILDIRIGSEYASECRDARKLNKVEFGNLKLLFLLCADPYRKVGLSSSKKISFYLLQWKPFKNDEKCFLFHFKRSFRFQDI